MKTFPNMRHTITFAGPENVRNGIVKNDNSYGEFSEWGPIVDGKKDGYWTGKYNHDGTVI
jgi:hypothetical protein